MRRRGDRAAGAGSLGLVALLLVRAPARPLAVPHGHGRARRGREPEYGLRALEPRAQARVLVLERAEVVDRYRMSASIYERQKKKTHSS
jgi:hypothetical protein